MQLDNGLKITFIGHATFLFDTPGGKRLLIDPWLAGNPACAPEFKNNEVPGLDYILCTHGHFDHIGDLVHVGVQSQALTVAPFELVQWMNKKGVTNTSPINPGGTIDLDGGDIKVTMVRADHSSSVTDEELGVLYAGAAGGYIVEFENGYKVYHMGDTAVFGDLALFAEIYQPDLTLVPIGGRLIMSPREAAHAIRLLGAKKVVPMHYGTFPLLTGTPEELEKPVAGQDVELVMMQPGDVLQ